MRAAAPARVIIHCMTGKRPPAARRFLRRALTLLAALLLCGCPYVSEEPLSDPASARLDPALVGAWRMQDPETGEWQSIVFLPFNDREMVAYAPADAPGEASVCRVFVTTIGNERFLNIRELGTDSAEWYFARCTTDGKRCVLRLIDDALFDARSFSSPQDRLEFIRAHLSDARLYGSEGEDPSEMIMERVADAD
jgi:hypothetical protein